LLAVIATLAASACTPVASDPDTSVLYAPAEAGTTQPPSQVVDAGLGTTPGAPSGNPNGTVVPGGLDAGLGVDAGNKPVVTVGLEAGVDGAASGEGGAVNSDAGTPVAEPAVTAGCGSAKLYETNAQDPGLLGPWPVGVKTLKVPAGSATLNVEVWYPAKLNSQLGKAKQTYDLRDWLPMGAVKIPDAKNKLAVCECYRDLPLDTDHGPYPAVVYIHGLGSMRVASESTMAVWASHGFVVIAADHPGDMLTDFLAGFGALEGCTGSGADPGDMAFEANAVMAAMNAKSAGFDFFGTSMDLTRMALGGHSQGGGTVAGMANTPNVKVVITLAPLGGGALNAPVDSMLQVTGTIDSVVGYSTSAYTSDTSKIRRMVGITNAGHIDVTDLCKEKNPEGKTGIQVASDEGVCGALILSGLAQCGGDPVATDVAPLIVNYATTAALEETLHCVNRDAAFSALKTKYPQISEFLHTP
jgi:hypothetical protein